jgi:hypothetical protein
MLHGEFRQRLVPLCHGSDISCAGNQSLLCAEGKAVFHGSVRDQRPALSIQPEPPALIKFPFESIRPRNQSDAKAVDRTLVPFGVPLRCAILISPFVWKVMAMIWKDTAETFVARLRIKIFIISEPSDYIIYSQQTGHKTVIRAGGSIQ